MKRLYFLFTLILSTFLYPSDHSQGMQRRGSTPSLFPERRVSFLERFFGGEKDGEPKPLLRRRTRSAGEVVYPAKTKTTSLSSSLQCLDLKPELPLPISNSEITELYKQALEYLKESDKAKNSNIRNQLRAQAEACLEVLRRAHYKPAIELLLTRIYSQDIDTRLSSQITALEQSLLANCAGNPELLAHFNALRIHRLQTKADNHRFLRHKLAFLSFIGLSISVDFDEKKAQKFKDAIEDLTRQNQALEDQARALEHTEMVLTAG